MEIILKSVAVLVILGTMMPLVRCDYWLVRAWDFPRLQLFVLGLGVMPFLWRGSMAGGADAWDIVIIAGLGLALVALAVQMIRYTPLFPKEVLRSDGESGIKIIISNVLMTNRKSDRLLKLVREYRPDLFVTLEVDEWWAREIATLDDIFPHGVNVPLDNTYGMIMRSRLPLIDPRVEYLVHDDIPSIHADLELSDGSLVHLHAVHPKPPFPDEAESALDRDAELLVVGKRAEQHGGPTIVLGDLNDVAWSRTTRLFQKISRLLDPRIGRGFYSTFHAKHWFMRWPLDHVFISDHFRVRTVKRLPFIESDHFPIYVDFSFEPEEKDEQEAPDADHDDHKEAAATIQESEEKNGRDIS